MVSVALKAPATLAPVVFAFLRDVIASVVLLSAAYWVETGRGGRFMPAAADAGAFIFFGVLGVWGAQGLSAMAIAELTPAFFSMLSPLYPVIGLTLAMLVGMEPFTRTSMLSWGKVAGILVATGGAIGLAVTAGSSDSSVRAESRNFGLGLFYAAGQVSARAHCHGSAHHATEPNTWTRCMPTSVGPVRRCCVRAATRSRRSPCLHATARSSPRRGVTSRAPLL